MCAPCAGEREAHVVQHPQIQSGGGGMNLYQSFAAVAQRNAERTAIVEGAPGSADKPAQQITFGELLRRVEGMAAVLAAFTQRDSVGIYLPTCAGFAVSAYGAFRAGFSMVPLN